ncbi:polymeric immunoglobulin receptor-like isoform X2 [Pygocentrus nattereri]|uniref:polymeric immunoglobulin receptor-like isoform X2 n=1 Tax=Pygocentrus nattereri TaxID=42514 RepID=UPI0018914A4A|nr:polymeric immunoglobulin receptor-like isoform X2 [Pygocentrus nattereri]
MHFYSLLSSLILFVLLLCISDSESLKTLKNLTVKHGESLTIPCFYDEKYKSNLKYWCKGYFWFSCKIVASTNTSTSVTDHPTQNMFIVELNSLQDSDSGYYWCAVEIGGKETPDDKDYLYLTVSADPAVSVINSKVSGQEGGSVSVQCLYSAEYKNKKRNWCRFEDRRCFSGGKTTEFYNSVVLVIDYGKGSVSVEMRGLQKSDAGWYWFSAGDVEVPVHLTVTERPSTTTAVTTVCATEETCIGETTSGSETMRKNKETTAAELRGNTGLLWVLLAVGLGLLLILTIVTTSVLIKKCNGSQTETRGRVSNTAVHTVSSASDHENDVIYSSVTTTTKKKTLFQAVRDDEVIYSSVVLK